MQLVYLKYLYSLSFNLILITCYKTFFGKIFFFIPTIFAFSLLITKVENKKPLLLPMLNFLEGFKKKKKASDNSNTK